MNKKVLKVMIALVGIFLFAIYALKIFIPEQFIMLIENPWLINFGQLVDSSWWLHEVCAIITSFITYWFYICAVTHKWYLNWKEIIGVAIAIALNHTLYEFDVTIATYIPIIAMIVLPAISNARLRDVAIVFTFHCLAQLASTSIRSLPLLLTHVNYATILMLTLECYFWLLLFYLLFNYPKQKKEETENG